MEIKSKYDYELSIKIKKYIKEQNNISNLVFLCIGTDRMTGDAFGPLVGSKIKEKLEKYNINVYGTLDKNVCWTNIGETIEKIYSKYSKPCIIAVDSALSKKENIGKIIVSKEKMHIGGGLNKKKIEVGDISIKAVVGSDLKIPEHNFYALQNVSLNEVMKMVNTVSNGIFHALNVY